MIVVPEMIGSVIGVYSGKEFNQVEIKPEMVGHYHAEFRVRRPDGERVLEEVGQVRFDAQGQPLRMFGSTLDVTEQRRAARALAEAARITPLSARIRAMQAYVALLALRARLGGAHPG